MNIRRKHIVSLGESELTPAETEEGLKGIGRGGDLAREFAPVIIKDSPQTSASRRQLTPDAIDEALKESSTTRWRIALSLVDNKNGLTVAQLATIVGKSFSWTLKQVKEMKEKKILKVDEDSRDHPKKGLVYRLAVDSEVLEQCKGYLYETQSLIGKPMHFQAVAVRSFDTDGSAIRHGFIPVTLKVRKSRAGDEEEFVVIQKDNVIVAKTFEQFIDMVEFLSSAGASTGVAEDKPERTARAGSRPRRVSPERERLPSGMTITVH